MKRKMELILRILFYAEEKASGSPLRPPRLTDYSPEEIKYHIRLCQEAGYLHLFQNDILNLTWEGHEFIDRNRD